MTEHGRFVFLLIGSPVLALVGIAGFCAMSILSLRFLDKRGLHFNFTIQDWVAGVCSLLPSGLSVGALNLHGQEMLLGLLTHYSWQAGFIVGVRSFVIWRRSERKCEGSAVPVFAAGLVGFVSSMVLAVLVLLVLAYFTGFDGV